jgi:hypothetical protein
MRTTTFNIVTSDQTRIVAKVERRLSMVEKLESVVTTNLQQATRLRQSILQKAFILLPWLRLDVITFVITLAE